MKGVTVVDGSWLTRLATNLCVFSKPLENPAPHYDADVSAPLGFCPLSNPHFALNYLRFPPS